MSEEEKEDSQLEGLLGDIPDVEYPRDLFDARRAKFVTSVRKAKKPGCPLFGIMMLSIITLVGWTSYLIITSLF